MKGKLPALTLLMLALVAGSATATPARHGVTRFSVTRFSVTRFSPEALLNAGVPWSTVQAVAGKRFWPELPAFNSIVDQEDPQPLTAVTQSYEDPAGTATIAIRLYAYASTEISLEYLQSAEIVAGALDQSSPAIGDRHFYYVTSLTDGTPSTRFTFTHGPIGAQIQVDGQLWSRSKIAKLGVPLDQRIAQLLAGSLHAAPVPAEQLAHLPAAKDAPGPVLGTASVAAEAWAIGVHKASPTALRNELVAAGNVTFPFRRYLRKGSPFDVIETSVFTFRSPQAARNWFAPFAAGVEQHPADALDAGNTGAHSTFRLELSNYELQFVAGRHVADVFCWAPFVADSSTGCEAATRTLAGKWYAELAG